MALLVVTEMPEQYYRQPDGMVFLLLEFLSVTSNIPFKEQLVLLSQPNNNNNLNNKITITVVGLRLSNYWEPPTHPPPTTNSKLHDRAEIEQNSENKSY